MADHEQGYESELGSRNYRPEYPATHVREHKVYWPEPHTVSFAIRDLKRLDALHRAVFVAAAHASGGLFLDLMQVQDEIPVPDGAWCAILNDDEPSTGGAKGPGFFDQPSLTRLFRHAKTIVVSSVGARASIYAIACDRAATAGETCLLVETQPDAARAWMAFAQAHGGGRYQLVKPASDAQDWLAENMVKNKAWRNPF